MNPDFVNIRRTFSLSFFLLFSLLQLPPKLVPPSVYEALVCRIRSVTLNQLKYFMSKYLIPMLRNVVS